VWAAKRGVLEGEAELEGYIRSHQHSDVFQSQGEEEGSQVEEPRNGQDGTL
jgi:hypothetical protein